ncbi:hypothetical protein ACHHYP_04054 [Achlya hypogyna]|uniref:Uncharacterized protein n=1 Tax=Achlya hypogyna TaxID=1202772 RepID=A0A1V9Z2J4_ACHHY|nr:hypothetical protein ACHHYP_04054 [Achlya hypogyna]
MAFDLPHPSRPFHVVLLHHVASQLVSGLSIVLLFVVAVNLPLFLVFGGVIGLVAHCLCDPHTTKAAMYAMQTLLAKEAILLQLR